MKKIPFELLVWISTLIYFACIDPAAKHMSLCLFRFIGWTWCPGCGIGHSISFLLHGQLKLSFDAHPLGFFAIAVILHRIYILINAEWNNYKYS